MNSREFLEKGLGNFYPNNKSKEFGIIFDLLTVYKKIRPCCLYDQEIYDKTLDIYPGIFNLFQYYNPLSEKNEGYFIYHNVKPKEPEEEVFDSFSTKQTYIGEILGYLQPGALNGKIPNESKLHLRYEIFKNGQLNSGFMGYIINEDVDDSIFVKKIEKICLEICIPGESYAVRKITRTHIYLSTVWLRTLYSTTNIRDNFIRRGEENGFEKQFLEEVFQVYKENLEMEVEISKKEISLISKIYPTFFIFTETKKGYKITKNTNLI